MPGVTVTWKSIVLVFSPVLLMKSTWDRSPPSLMARLAVEKLKSAAVGFINEHYVLHTKLQMSRLPKSFPVHDYGTIDIVCGRIFNLQGTTVISLPSTCGPKAINKVNNTDKAKLTVKDAAIFS